MDTNLFNDVRGAVYIPARAFNAWQMWAEFDANEIERDLGYAHSVNLNALRIWLSYEYWLEQPEKALADFETMLERSARQGIRLLVSLFENCGVPFTPEAARDKGLFTAFALQSPGPEVIGDPSGWRQPRVWVETVIERYRDDTRLLAIEVMNEPWWFEANQAFALAMLDAAQKRKGRIPLTMGTLGDTAYHNLVYVVKGIDILQYHDNFPDSVALSERRVREAKLVERLIGKPVWLTEWQRLRLLGSGWGEEPIGGREWEPALATLAPVVHRHRIGSFFWSLMIKPAYLQAQRRKGTLNGLFHEDGAVWSLEDARAVAHNPEFTAVERKVWPDWCAEIARKTGISLA